MVKSLANCFLVVSDTCTFILYFKTGFVKEYFIYTDNSFCSVNYTEFYHFHCYWRFSANEAQV